MTDMSRQPGDAGVLRVGNCSGFYGDRLSAMREMLEGGRLDVLTGDYLAELTMLILGRDRARDQGLGYVRTFLRQLEDCLGLAQDKGVRIVTNAGGLNPHGCAAAVHHLAGRLGLDVSVAVVDGDDLTDRAAELGLGTPLAANAYLGGFGVAAACRAGTDVVITGRVTDASVVVGPAIARFDWGRTEFDAIAGAMAAGHVIECGTQATGGNLAFFREIPNLTRPGFPIAEIRRDGSSVVTKHPGTGGAVTIDTVVSQLLYEVQDARYAGPDAVLRLDSVTLEQQGPDRVLLAGVRGEPPPPDLKVSCTSVGGYRGELTFVLTGLDIEAKAELARRQVEAALPVRPAQLTWTLARTDHEDPDTQARAAATLTVTARDPDERKVGRAFSGAAVEIALASYPGCFLTSPPGGGSAYGVYRPAYVRQEVPAHTVTLPGGERVAIEPPSVTRLLEPLSDDLSTRATSVPHEPGSAAYEPVVSAPLGTIVGARSGDKGGNANVGVWVRSDDEFAWLDEFLTVDRLRELLPETRALTVTRTRLPRLRALNFVIEGLLGEGVAYAARFDPQAKALGEWLRARHVGLPARFLPAATEVEHP
ncbi:acyclic terpene utilization AtuA family protein [Intrasporangium sp.]|uniref:acyclic terpene utilization AtuA family protein n=1 Tax=Intrasporangium sp. TaxID=1925024 RepID=UPI0032213F1D